jgi:EAL domain-containing protein (putative c-di-GMP-specific phosphodiesterase class I)
LTPARRRVLGVATAVTLALAAGAVIGVTSLLDHTLTRASERDAAQDAQLIAQVGFATATSDGRPSRADLRTAHQQIAAARRTHDLGTVVVWDRAGRPLFTDPLGTPAPSRTPAVVRRAIETGRTATGVAGDRAFETAVPVSSGARRLFAQFEFPRDSAEHDLAHVKRRIYLGAGLGGVVLFAALLPLTGWVAGRLPTHADRRREAALARLDAAIARGELCLHFQPKLATGTRRLDGVEALVRWEHPERGLVPPGDFIPLLEHSHLVDRFTGAVVDAAAEACGRWRAEGLVVPVAVNISAPALTGGRLVDQVAAALERSGIPPALLTMEITESAVMTAGPEATGTLVALRELGVKISMDDFGTGYSSLRRLWSLPLDELKIDRSFVNALATDERVLTVTRLIVDLARELDLSVTAEGVETAEELEQVTALGCDAVQGFLLARPMAESDLRRWLAEHGHELGER